MALQCELGFGRQHVNQFQDLALISCQLLLKATNHGEVWRRATAAAPFSTNFAKVSGSKKESSASDLQQDVEPRRRAATAGSRSTWTSSATSPEWPWIEKCSENRAGNDFNSHQLLRKRKQIILLPLILNRCFTQVCTTFLLKFSSFLLKNHWKLLDLMTAL